MSDKNKGRDESLQRPPPTPIRENGKAPGGQGAAPQPGRVDDKTRVQGAVQEPQRQAPPPGKKKRKKKKKVHASAVFVAILVNFLKAGLVLFCVALMVGSVVVVQVVQYVVAETQNDDTVLDIENIKLAQTSYIVAQNPTTGEWEEYQELIGPENRIWVDLAEIPDNLVNAVIATEDTKFNEHHGVNFERTAYALLNDLFQIEDLTFGASTIHQQLVKNLTGDSDTGTEDDRSDGYQRKLREIFRAWGLANSYSKDMVMEAYLNTMSLSGRIAGVQAGAQEYFSKEVSDLTLAECATIAGITRAPSAYSPYENPEECLARRDRVLGYMYNEGYIPQSDYTAALAQPLGVTRRTQKEGSTESRSVFNYFSDKVFEDVVKDFQDQEGLTRTEAINKVYTGGYTIYATVEQSVQQTLEDMYLDGYEEGGYFLDQSRFPGYASRLAYTEENADGTTETILPQSAAVVINYQGELVATVGGIGEKTESLALNRGIGTVDSNGEVQGTVRQVGSTMKPIAAYALGLDLGIITYSSGVRDNGIQSRDPVKSPNARDWPKNFSNRYRNTTMPVVSAIAESTNTVAAQVGLWVGRDAMFEFLRDTLQVTSLVEPDDMDLGPLVLGSMTHGMCAYELAGAYMMFGGSGTDGTYGVYNSLHSYTKVEDSRGNIVLEPERTSVQAVDPQTGYIMNRMLSQVLRGSGLPGGATGTARGMALEGEMDSVAKTGTTSDDKDRWFVGLTPYYVTAVWWGYDVPDKYDFYGRWGPAASTNVPPNVWKDLMETVQAEKEVIEFPAQPEGIEELAFCTSSGDLAGPGCGRMQGYYAGFNIPETCRGHRSAEEEAAAAAAAAEAPPA